MRRWALNEHQSVQPDAHRTPPQVELTMPVETLSQEEQDAILYDARDGDLEFLQGIFPTVVPGSLLHTIRDEHTLSTPIHMASGNGHKEVVEFLLGLVSHEEAVKLASTPNESGNTPLHWAALNGHLPVVELLVEQFSADVFQKNGAGRDALFEAERNGQADVENWFLRRFAPEDQVKVDELGSDTKITFTPGQESYEIDQQAVAALEAEEAKNGVKEVEEKTSELKI